MCVSCLTTAHIVPWFGVIRLFYRCQTYLSNLKCKVCAYSPKSGCLNCLESMFPFINDVVRQTGALKWKFVGHLLKTREQNIDLRVCAEIRPVSGWSRKGHVWGKSVL